MRTMHNKMRQRRPVSWTGIVMLTLILIVFAVGFLSCELGSTDVKGPHQRLGISLAGTKSDDVDPDGSFTVSGSVDGLYPGASAQLPLVVKNPNSFPIRIRQVETRVDPAPGCSAQNLSVGSIQGEVVVPARGEAKANLPVQMSTAATDACQLARFPLTFTGTADQAGPPAATPDSSQGDTSNPS